MDTALPMGMLSDTIFYSQLTSSAQRLPNGNTMICEGCGERFTEVTADKEVVWEYIAPFGKGQTFWNHVYMVLTNDLTNSTQFFCFSIVWTHRPDGEYIAPFGKGIGFTYRAYRYPYEYVPQLPKPEEVPVEKVDIHTFRMPGAAEGMITEDKQVAVTGTWGYTRMDECVTEDSTSGQKFP